MADTLSQNEIDELISALSSGDVDVKEIEDEKKDKKVRKYDFRRPDKFAKDQLRTLEIIHENFGRLLNSFLSGYLRTFVEVNVISVQSFIYSEFSDSISNPAILGVVEFAPFEGDIIIDVSSEIAYCMIERVLGWVSKTSPSEGRALTEIEITLIKNIMLKMINLLRDPWDNIVELNPRLKNIETNSQFAQIVSPSESVALITFNVKVGDNEGMLNICIPHFVIEPILPNLSTRLWFATSSRKVSSGAETERIKSSIVGTHVTLTAEIGKSTLSVSELMNLQKGDIILLDSKAEEPIDVKVENQLKFKAVPGLKNKNIAVRITEVIDEDNTVDNKVIEENDVIDNEIIDNEIIDEEVIVEEEGAKDV